MRRVYDISERRRGLFVICTRLEVWPREIKSRKLRKWLGSKLYVDSADRLDTFGDVGSKALLTSRLLKLLMLKIPVQRALLANPSYTLKAIKLDPQPVARRNQVINSQIILQLLSSVLSMMKSLYLRRSRLNRCSRIRKPKSANGNLFRMNRLV